MQKKLYFFALLLSIFLFLSMQSASASLAVTVTPEQRPLSAYHGQSIRTSFTISNNNVLCSVSCDVSLRDRSSNRVIQSSNIRMNAGRPIDYNVDVTAPSKASGGISGQTIYNLNFDCIEISSLTCWTSSTDEATALITLNYDLTPEERSAKTFIDSNKDRIKTSLESIEKKIYNINSKFNALARNVLVTDLKSKLQSFSNDFSSAKRSYDTIMEFYDNLDFLRARDNYNQNLPPLTSNLDGNLDGLNNDLEERIRRHNELVVLLSSVASEVTQAIKLANIIDDESISTISSTFESLSIRFNEGSFQSYDGVESELRSISFDIAAFMKRLESDAEKIFKTGKGLVENEYARLCKEKSYCEKTSLKESREMGESLLLICDEISKKIKPFFEKANTKSLQEYETQLKKVNMNNEKRKENNEVIENMNDLLDELGKTINHDSLNIELASCLSQVDNIRNLLKENNENSIDIGLLSECNAALDQAKKMKEDKKGFFTKIKNFLLRLWPFDNVRIKDIAVIELGKVPEKPTVIDLTTETKEYYQKSCGNNIVVNMPSVQINTVNDPLGETLTSTSIKSGKEHKSQCCIFGACNPCCEGNVCRDDARSYPIIFLHGHSFLSWNSPEYSLDAFNTIQSQLADEGYLSAGVVLPTSSISSIAEGEWGRSGAPVTIKATYYYNVYDENGRLINRPSNTESITTYANRLKDVIDIVKHHTGRNKVNLVVHSMGGLVAREYIRNYDSASVDKLIMVGTPNRGISENAYPLCWTFGSSVECNDMRAGSSFLNTLNNGDETPGSTKYYTIGGTGCSTSGNIDGDGLIRYESVTLNGATNVQVNGRCESPLDIGMHTKLLNQNAYPRTYDYIKQFLSGE